MGYFIQDIDLTFLQTPPLVRILEYFRSNIVFFIAALVENSRINPECCSDSECSNRMPTKNWSIDAQIFGQLSVWKCVKGEL